MYEKENIKKTIDYKEALTKCTALCSRAEYSVWDIRERLTKWDIEENHQDDIINYLISNNYINEERYAESFISDKLKFSKWGRIKIKYALHQKRISESIIYKILNDINEEEYYKTLVDLISNKAKYKSGEMDIKKRASIYNFALSRGFEPELINRALRKLLAVSC
ncbi:MAG: RecX family transcriptional regulator [Bacteroidales bacterium]|nr:RecX family transcriptional regulator [Bacteroidales bacterium]